MSRTAGWPSEGLAEESAAPAAPRPHAQAGAGRPRASYVHQAIAIQAERSPDAPAVVAAGRHLSYRELNDRANRLAHRLAGLG